MENTEQEAQLRPVAKEAEQMNDHNVSEDSSSEEDDSFSRKAAQALTCRKVTLNNLMEDGLIEAGESVLTIDYLGQKFEADLLPNGRIKWHGSEVVFGTPSAWALHCKKLVNPIKRSGCGWASVKYKNKKLDIWKSMWARKQRLATSSKSPHVSPGARMSTSSMSDQTNFSPRSPRAGGSDRKGPASPTAGTSQKPETSFSSQVSSSTRLLHSDENGAQARGKKFKSDDEYSNNSSRDLPSPTPGPLPPKAILQQPNRGSNPHNADLSGLENYPMQHQYSSHQYHGKRLSIPYSALGHRGLDVDPLTLIKCENFDNLSKIQPFTVSVTSNTLLLMDFHCHLTKSEVVGYLGGRWDNQRHHLSIEQAFPCKCRLADKDKAAIVEEEIQRSMRRQGLMIVGWYHSHPRCSPDPSLKDIDCQMAYQLRMKGSASMYLPCVGFIISPFEKSPPRQDSNVQAFWVMPNLEHPTSFNIPMHVSYSVNRDQSLTEDLLADLKSLCEYYNGAIDKVYLRDFWGEAITYMDKIKASLRSKLPEDQLDSGTFLDYVQQLLGDIK